MADGSAIISAAQAGEPPVVGDVARPTSPSSAPAPFDNLSTDIVLRSADHVDFHVWRVILREASVFFANTFADAQSGPSDAPLVPMTESARTVEALLRLCYPVPDPEFASIDDLKPVMVAARKYQMDYIMQVLTRHLLVLAENTPLQAYAVALQFELVDTAREAGRLTLRHDDPCRFTADLDTMPATAYYHLSAYRRECAEAACGTVEWFEPDASTFVWFRDSASSSKCSCSMATGNQYYIRLPNSDRFKQVYVTSWLDKHLGCVKTALLERPYGGAVLVDGLCDQMLQDATSCNTCKHNIHSDTRKFMSGLAAEVNERISTARISSQSASLHTRMSLVLTHTIADRAGYFSLQVGDEGREGFNHYNRLCLSVRLLPRGYHLRFQFRLRNQISMVLKN